MARLSRRGVFRGPSVAKAASLVDDFRSLSGTKWPNTNAAVAQGWRLALTLPGSGHAFVNTDTVRYDLTNSSIHAEFAVLPTAATSSTYMMARQSFSPDNFVFIGREGGNLLMRECVAGTSSDTTLTYDFVYHRWVRLRHSGTSLMWETSNNGITWTTRRTTTTGVALASVMLSFETTWYTTPIGVGRAEIANVNVNPYNPPVVTEPPRFFGSLVTKTASGFAAAEYAGGCRVAEQDQAWSVYETADNVFSTSEKNSKIAELATLKGLGYVVSMSMGHHYTPAYVSALSGGVFVNEAGTSSSQANLVFSSTTRGRMERYMSRLHTDLNLNNYWSIRISAAGNGEFLYPEGGWWAYDTNAQGGAGLPATVPPCPYPGWKPGQTTITVAQAGEWLEWYLDALVDSANWQMKYLRDLGFTGWFEILIPGNGTRPTLLASDLSTNRLEPGAWETAVGAVWHKIVQKIAEKRGVICYCTSVADISGTPLYNVTTTGDAAVDIVSSTADTWSAARWIARLGREYGMPLNGENPGWDTTINARYIDNTSTGLMAKCFDQIAAADYLVFNWAHSDQLHDGTIPLSNYTTRIAAVNGGTNPLPPNPPA
jgi:hypothetical protein